MINLKDEKSKLMSNRLRRLAGQAVRRFPDNNAAADAWLEERAEKVMDTDVLWPFAKCVRDAAMDAFDMFPEDENAAMDWMRQSIDGHHEEVSDDILEIYREAYLTLKDTH